MSRAPTDQIKLNTPAGLRDQLHEAARNNGRSLNSEIVHRLQTHTETSEGDMAKGNTLTVRITDETKERLDQLSKRGPYRISMTSIVERGIELAAAELEQLK